MAINNVNSTNSYAQVIQSNVNRRRIEEQELANGGYHKIEDAKILSITDAKDEGQNFQLRNDEQKKSSSDLGVLYQDNSQAIQQQASAQDSSDKQKFDFMQQGSMPKLFDQEQLYAKAHQEFAQLRHNSLAIASYNQVQGQERRLELESLLSFSAYA